MQSDTDGRGRSRRQTLISTVLSSLWEVFSGILILWLRGRLFPHGGTWSIVLLILALLDFFIIIPILVTARQRLNEIAGGEEDEARHY